jgi:hypothetical protein
MAGTPTWDANAVAELEKTEGWSGGVIGWFKDTGKWHRIPLTSASITVDFEIDPIQNVDNVGCQIKITHTYKNIIEYYDCGCSKFEKCPHPTSEMGELKVRKMKCQVLAVDDTSLSFDTADVSIGLDTAKPTPTFDKFKLEPKASHEWEKTSPTYIITRHPSLMAKSGFAKASAGDNVPMGMYYAFTITIDKRAACAFNEPYPTRMSISPEVSYRISIKAAAGRELITMTDIACESPYKIIKSTDWSLVGGYYATSSVFLSGPVTLHIALASKDINDIVTNLMAIRAQADKDAEINVHLAEINAKATKNLAKRQFEDDIKDAIATINQKMIEGHDAIVKAINPPP